MAEPEQRVVGHQVDYFAVITLIVTILVLIFLVVSVMYFNAVANLTPPTRAESTFLLWSGVVIIIGLAALAVFALIRIFYYYWPVLAPVQVAPVQVVQQPAYLNM